MQLSLLTVVSMILVLVSASAESISLRGGSMKRGLLTTKCSDSGSSEQYGGDCSATPTYCGRDSYGPQPQAPGPDDFWDNEDPLGIPPGDNVVSCRYQEPRDWYFEDDIPVEYSDARDACYKPDKRCNEEALKDYPQWCRSNYMMRFGGYHGGCSGTNNCLNLDFHCADGEYCGMSCTGGNSCEGLTMYCAANQFCEIQNCGDGTERCVGAKAVCGEGTVAQGLACVPMDQPNNCRNPILPLGTTYSPTTSPTTAPTTSPTEPFILTPIISYTCVGVTCSDESDGSTCGSDGGCCPYGDTPSDGQCSCGTSWSDANMNKIPCKLTQQQPEPQPETALLIQQQLEPEPETASPTSNPTSEPEPETASPTSNPTSEPQPETSSPTFNLATLSIGSGCCSQNFRTCASYGGDSKESCELNRSMIWLENGDTQQCLEQWSRCTKDINACCPGLTCIGNEWYRQCLL